MKILVTGGNGNISWWFVQLAIEAGHDVYAIGRSFDKPTRKSLPPEVIKIETDIRNIEQTKSALTGLHFDVVCDFLCFNKEQALNAIELFQNKTEHYIFISSESIYKRETNFLPFKENSPMYDPKQSGNYVKGKIEAEQVFIDAYEKMRFPLTIVRPSYTYDTMVPVSIGLNCYTALERYNTNNTVLIAGDGMNLWTFTHAEDFANALLGIINNKSSIGEDYIVTSDEWLTWMDATNIVLNHLQLYNSKKIHIPRDIVLAQKLLGERDMLEHKMFHNIFDNSKIKTLLPSWKANISFNDGVVKSLNWFNELSVRKRINPQLDELIVKIIKENS